jgi:hypothetical protein
MVDGAFPINPVLTGITISYRNKKLIADDVLPRVDAVGAREFKWNEWDLSQGVTVPETEVGRKSAPNEVEFTATERTGRTTDHALDDVLPLDEVREAEGRGLDPIGNATETLTDLILLKREVRVAGLVFNPATYGDQVTELDTAAKKWTDAENSDPVGNISDALEVPLIRPNTAIFGRSVWSVLSRHPKILRAVNPLGVADGIARRQAVADLFELDEIIVGEARLNIAKKGQPMALSRVWGGSAAFIYKDALARDAAGGQMTFGMTVPFGERVAGDMPEPKIGMRGSIRVRAGESVAEIITAAGCGYLIDGAI